VTLILITYKIICSAANDGYIAISSLPFSSITNPAQRYGGWEADLDQQKEILCNFVN
jgi:hypothetical protein